MQVLDLPVPPGPPHAGLKSRVLDELLLNPFLDEDLQALAIRLHAPSSELSEALDGLCQERFLKRGGQRGYLLDLEGIEPAAASPSATEPGEVGRIAFPELALPLDSVVETLPFGVVVLRADGTLELANTRASEWLGIPGDDLDGATFELATGVDPVLVIGGATAITFSLKEPRPLEISLHACGAAGEAAVLIVVRDASLQEEVTRMQVQVQEQLFARLGSEVVEPLRVIEEFLEDPQGRGLGAARAALEQINWFLGEFMLRRPPPADGRDAPELEG